MHNGSAPQYKNFLQNNNKWITACKNKENTFNVIHYQNFFLQHFKFHKL